MTFLNETTRGTNVFAGIGEFFAGLSDTWNRYRVFRRTYDELSVLSTRELNDLGISRSMITRLAYEAAYGPSA